MRYLDSSMSWTEPEVKPKTYSITCKGDTPEQTPQHQHVNFFSDEPTEAVAGEVVTINVSNHAGDLWTSGSVHSRIGITDTSISNLGDNKPPAMLEQVYEIYDEYWRNIDYTFTMPDHDVIVWFWCSFGTGSHAS